MPPSLFVMDKIDCTIFFLWRSHHSGAPLKGRVELKLSLENSTKLGSLPSVEVIFHGGVTKSNKILHLFTKILN